MVGDNVSNNYAEYSALVAALNELLHRGLTKDVTVKSDSKLLVYQMSGRWKKKKGGYLEKYKTFSRELHMSATEGRRACRSDSATERLPDNRPREITD